MISKIITYLSSLYFKNNLSIKYIKKQKIFDNYQILFDIIKKNKFCHYGQKYNFSDIKSYDDYINFVPIVTYEDIADIYIQSCIKWEPNILTTYDCIYFAQTSGTTTGRSKYIPVTRLCLDKNHFSWGRSLISNYLSHNPDSKLLQGKSLILGGWFTTNSFTWVTNIWYISAILQKESGIIWKLFREPSEDIAFLHDRNTKLDKIIDIYKDQNIVSMWWVTSWALILLEKLLEKTWKQNILEIRPNFSLYISWWLNFEPYRDYFNRLFPSKQIQFYNCYNASEWFFGIQYDNDSSDMILLTNHGVFYEFIDMDTYFDNQSIYTLDNIETRKKYAIVITTYWWLYRYEIGDVIEFVDIDLFLFKIVGRTKVYIDVFSEHVIVDNTDQALLMTCKQHWVVATDYHVWPIFADQNWKWSHEWIIYFPVTPSNQAKFIQDLDSNLQSINAYYAGKRSWDLMIQMPIIHFVNQDVFIKRFESKGKVWWQNKIPRLANDRKILDDLLSLI